MPVVATALPLFYQIIILSNYNTHEKNNHYPLCLNP